MARKGKLKTRSILVALNILVLLIIAGYYGFRMYKYYNLQNNYTEDDGSVLLANELLTKISYLDLTKGLVYNKEKDTYTFKGNVEDNYLYYSGFLFRIIGIDKEGNIKAVTQNSATNLYSGLEKSYESSYLNKWLNQKEEVNFSGVFENLLYNKEELTTYTHFCTDSINDLEKITCEKDSTDYNYVILSLNDYKEAGGKNSYLNNGETFYLSDTTDKNENYYITNEGEVSLNQTTTLILGIRPVVTFRSSVVLLDGNGTKEKPYIIEQHDKKTLEDTYANDIIKLDNVLYKVISKTGVAVKLASVEPLKYNNEDLKTKFGSNNVYSTSQNLGSYLNTTFYNSLSFKENIITAYWFVGDLSLTNLDYAAVFNDKSKANIGLLTLGELDLFGVKNVFTLLKNYQSKYVINVVREDGSFFGDSVGAKYAIRPSFYLKKELKITGGNGTLESPYEIGGIDEKEESK